MPTDNEMPEFVQAEVRISRAWVKTDQDRAVVWLADALDRAQRELTAFAEWAAEFGGDDLHNDPKAHAKRQIERYRASLPSPETKP